MNIISCKAEIRPRSFDVATHGSTSRHKMITASVAPFSAVVSGRSFMSDRQPYFSRRYWIKVLIVSSRKSAVDFMVAKGMTTKLEYLLICAKCWGTLWKREVTNCSPFAEKKTINAYFGIITTYLHNNYYNYIKSIWSRSWVDLLLQNRSK